MAEGKHHAERSVYRDLVRMGERILDFQISLVMDRLERTDRLIRLGVASLAGMIAVLGLMLSQRVPIDLAGAIGISISILLVMLNVYFLARSNSGLHRQQFVRIGPDMGALYDHVELDKGSDHHQFLSANMPAYIEHNNDLIRSLSSRQGRAVLIYGIGVGLFAIVILYIVGRLIHV